MTTKSNKWLFNDYKTVKLLGTNGRIAFQRKGKYTRGLSISNTAFLNMEDVTIEPGRRIELEPNVYLTNYGDQIHMVKYCLTADKKKCNGGFFTFTPTEWKYFWTKFRHDIVKALER